MTLTVGSPGINRPLHKQLGEAAYAFKPLTMKLEYYNTFSLSIKYSMKSIN